MAKYSGVIGVRGPVVQEAPGVLTRKITEIPVSGDIVIKPARWTTDERIQTRLSTTHVIKLYSAENSTPNFTDAVYATWQGKKWIISNYEFSRPQVFLTLGGLYNG